MADPIPFRGESRGDEVEGEISREAESRAFSDDERIYTNEEVSEIIRVALSRAEHIDRDTVNHSELVAIGRDFGLNEDDIEKAFGKLTQNRIVEEHSDRAWLAFKIHLIVYAVINTGLFFINWLADPSYWWVGFPVVAWGTLVALHGIITRYIPTFSNWLIDSGWNEAKIHIQAQTGYGQNAPIVASFTNELYDGLAEAKGIARVEEGMLYLEYQVKDGLFGGFKTRVKETLVPLEDLASAKLQRGIWSNKLILHGRRMRTFEGFPGKESGNEIRLTFSGAARQASEKLMRDIGRGVVS